MRFVIADALRNEVEWGGRGFERTRHLTEPGSSSREIEASTSIASAALVEVAPPAHLSVPVRIGQRTLMSGKLTGAYVSAGEKKSV